MTERELKELLQQLDAPYEPDTWAALARKLDEIQDPPVVDSVDKAVFRRLEQLEAPFEPAHWVRMSQRLDVMRRRTLLVRFGKTLEAAAIVLLLIRFAPEWLDGTMPYSPSTPPIARNIYVPPKVLPDNDIVEEGHAYVLPESDKVATPAHSATASSTVERNLAGNNPIPTAISALTTLAPLPQRAVQPVSSCTTIGLNEPLLPQNRQMLVEPLPLAEVEIPEPLKEEAVGAPIIQPVPKGASMYFAASILGELNRYRWHRGEQRVPSAGAGVAVGRRGERWQIEGGLNYSGKYFTPKRSVEIYDGNINTGYFGTALSGVDADVLQAPLRLMRRVGQFGRMKVLALAGLMPQAVLTKRYDYDAVFFEPPQSSGTAVPKPVAAPQHSQSGKGLLEGGSLSENAWMSADAGLQIEFPLGKHSRVFVQPVFRLALSPVELGPEPVRNNSFVLQAGVQTDL